MWGAWRRWRAAPLPWEEVEEEVFLQGMLPPSQCQEEMRVCFIPLPLLLPSLGSAAVAVAAQVVQEEADRPGSCCLACSHRALLLLLLLFLPPPEGLSFLLRILRIPVLPL